MLSLPGDWQCCAGLTDDWLSCAGLTDAGLDSAWLCLADGSAGLGWNNMRMRMEILLVISHVLGRTIVSPPPQHLYLLSQPFDDPMRPGKKISWPSLGFDDFYDISLLKSHKGLHVMSMKEFLAAEGTTGRLHTRDSTPLVPPGNKTDAWGKTLWKYLEKVADSQPEWNGKVVAFPATADEMKLINESHQERLKLADLAPKMPAAEFEQLQKRAGVFTAGRSMTTYTRQQQDAKLLHFPPLGSHRLLEHFYAFGFFADPNMQVQPTSLLETRPLSV